MKDTYDGTQNLDDYDVVKFYADWCQPCKVYAPIFDDLAQKDEDLKYIDVNTEHHPDAVQKFNVRAVPTVVVEGEKLDNYLAWTEERLAASS